MAREEISVYTLPYQYTISIQDDYFLICCRLQFKAQQVAGDIFPHPIMNGMKC